MNTESEDFADEEMRILIVDDVRTVRRVLKQQLATLAFNTVTEATSGPDALARISSEEFDLVICDYHLNGIDGLHLLKKVRAHPTMWNVPFIMITSDLSETELNAAKEAGVSSYMLKPFGIDALRDNIDEVLDFHASVSSEE